MAKAKAAASKASPKKQPKETAHTEIKFSDFIGKKLLDMGNEDGRLTIKFSNGYNIVVTGNIMLRKEKQD